MRKILLMVMVFVVASAVMPQMAFADRTRGNVSTARRDQAQERVNTARSDREGAVSRRNELQDELDATKKDYNGQKK